jgi:hypothetical protein
MIRLRIPTPLIVAMLADLRRPHAIAHERIGFLACRQSDTPQGRLLLGYLYAPVDDDCYLRDEAVGARFDNRAIRAGMQLALTEKASVMHVHVHNHQGEPRMSRVDAREMQGLMPCFVNVCPQRVHGALILSADRAFAQLWGTSLPGNGAKVSRITSVSDRVRMLS